MVSHRPARQTSQADSLVKALVTFGLSLAVNLILGLAYSLDAQEISRGNEWGKNTRDPQPAQPARTDFLSLFLGGYVYQIECRDSEPELSFQPDYGHSGIRLHDLRMAQFPEIQAELKLSTEQLQKMKPYFEELHQYQQVWQQEQAIRCLPLQQEALKRSGEMRQRITEEDQFLKLLTDGQRTRLFQLERRFGAMDLQEAPSLSGLERFRDWQLSERQRSQILKLIEQKQLELSGDNRKWEERVLGPFLKRVFDQDHVELLQELTSSSGLLASDPLIRAAQMAPLFRYDEIEKFDKLPPLFPQNADLDFQFLEPLVLANGRMVCRDDHFHRSPLSFGFSKWQRLLIFLENDQDDWLMLVPDQIATVHRLLGKEELIEGAISYRFVGMDEIVEHNRQAPDSIVTSSEAYRGFLQKSFELHRKADAQIRSQFHSTLTNGQKNVLQFAIGASQFKLLGIFLSLSEETLGPEFKLSRDHQEELAELIADRRQLEIQQWNELEDEVVKLLSPAQHHWFEREFGAPTAVFPSFLYQLNHHLLER